MVFFTWDGFDEMDETTLKAERATSSTAC